MTSQPMDPSVSPSLSSIARTAVQKYSNTSDIDIAIDFCHAACPKFVSETNDRLVKVGRSIRSLIELYPNDSSVLEDSLLLLRQECELLVSGKLKVPKVPFGKTGLQMPIVTLGCMRFQQEWGPRITNMNMVYSDCQDNLLALLQYAICTLGINHIETARGYGCSELQIGTALKQLFLSGKCTRSDLIIQTKVPPCPKAKDFRSALETSFRNLQVDYVDLFAFHGMNYPEQVDWVFGSKDGQGEETCLDVIQEYIRDGKIKHLGFSTHGSTDLILQLINTNVFEYVNIHYHYFGSYTASGGGPDGNGTLECIKLLHEKNMGIFIISPFDKGGRLYAPSKQLRSLTLPDMEPMSFMSYWIWNHDKIFKNNGPSSSSPPMIHTYTVGAGRPSDLDQPAVAAYLHATQNAVIVPKLKCVLQRLDDRRIAVLGEQWLQTWWKGLPKCDKCPNLIEHNQMIWMYNNMKAFGLYEFAKARYNSFEKNYYNKWDSKLSASENIENVGKNGWGFVPGLPLVPGKDYSNDLVNVPMENRKQIVEAELFIYHWCRDKESYDKLNDQDRTENNHDEQMMITASYPQYSSLLGSDTPTSYQQEMYDMIMKIEKECKEIPDEWTDAYDMRPWPDYPDQPRR